MIAVERAQSPETAAISRHAWARFIARWPDVRLPRCPEATLRRLLARAQPEDLGAGAVIRLLQHRTQPVRYYAVDGWRFVVTEERRHDHVGETGGESPY